MRLQGAILPEPHVHLSAHTALHSSMAHSHGNIMVARCNGVPFFVSRYIRVDFRIPPPELSFATGHQSAQRHSTEIASTASAKELPYLGFTLSRAPDPLPHQRLNGGPVLPCQPVREFPEDDSIQFPVHDCGIVSELVEIGPSR